MRRIGEVGARGIGARGVGLGVLGGIVVALGAGTAPLAGQESDAYLDPAAARLHRAASESWQAIDASVVRYTALVRQRIAAQLRTPLKDRTIYRSEAAARVFWDRDHETLTQVLASNAQYPGREYAVAEEGFNALDDFTIEGGFDPGGERLAFGFVDDDDDSTDAFQPSDEDFWFAHPLAPGADTLYRFRSADTLSLILPDGRRLDAVKLDVMPRVADVHRMSGSLWIEPESGALVRAAYRLSRQFDAIRDIPDLADEEARGEFKYVPGLFKPWTLDFDIMAVDYSLWDMRVWLPRSARFEGVVAAGVLKMPVAYDLAYTIESVVMESDLEQLSEQVPVTEEVHFRTRAEAMAFMAQLARDRGAWADGRPDGEAPGWRVDGDDRLVPDDLSLLAASPHLPPPIWDDAPGFATSDDIARMMDVLADLPAPPIQGIPWAANWGLQRPDLVRFNRVEGPALGGRFQARFASFMGPLSFSATGFFGFSDLEPKARLGLERESLRRRIELGGFREMRAVEARGRYLGLGNSLNGALFGRDDGEYFLATGADLEITPPSAQRRSWSLRLYGERQDPVETQIDFALFHAFDKDWRFRPNLPARALEEVGGEATLSPWWGTDPLAPQFGVELYGQAAAARDLDDVERWDYARARATVRAAVPMASGRWRLGIEVGAGTAWGEVPLQRNWLLGGPMTLRGYGASTAVGTSFGRGRLEVGRAFPAGSWSLFTDTGWAGDRADWTPDDLLWAVGVGASMLDGLVRFDISRGLSGSERRTRVDLYLDAIF